jgi:IS605 OrfB family transposase
MDRRYSRSAEEDINALRSAIEEKRNTSINELIKNIATIETKITKEKNKLIENIKNKKDPKNIDRQDIIQEKITKIRQNISFENTKLIKPKIKLNKLLEDQKNKKISLCFGAKKLFKKQFNKTVTHEDWYNEFTFKRNSSFRLTGAKDENCGNGNVQFRLIKHNCYELKIRLPISMEAQFGKHIVIENLHFPEKRNKLIQDVVLNNQSKNPNIRQPISFMIKKDKKGYRLITQFEPPKTIIKTSKKNGVIGLDINTDNFSVTEISRGGKFLDSKVFKFDLENKTSNQREDIIFNTMNKVVEYALSKKKDLVYEDLDFTEKRNNLKDNYNKNYARMLSSFAYSKMLSQLMGRAYREGVTLHGVNPAYTSLIGKIKYQVKYGVSSHQAASYVIARKIYKLKENIKNKLTVHHKGKAYMLRVPVRIREASGEIIHKELLGWFNSECKATSRWVQIIKGVPLIEPSG